jgi:NADH-quinone oxidoreductase subunit L
VIYMLVDPIYIWAIPYIGAVLSLIFSEISKKARNYVAVLSLLFSSIFATITLYEFIISEKPIHTSYVWIKSLGITFGAYMDGLSSFAAFLVSWLCFFIGFYSLKYMEEDPGLTRYWFFFAFFAGSMLTLITADNILFMFVGWEGTGLCSYALIGHWFTDEEERCVGDPGRKALGVSMLFTPSHSGVRALVFTRLGDVGFIAGIAIVYSVLKTFSIPEIVENASEWIIYLARLGLLLPVLIIFSLGALAKSAQFPFHEWLVTAMTGPTSVSALIHAATMVNAGVYFMLRFSPAIYFSLHGAHEEILLNVIENDVTVFFTIIATIGAFTAIFMASQAIVARELKLILAFSTASQLGYMFLAVGAAGLCPEFINGWLASFNHLMSQAVFKASLFMAAGAIIHTVESRFIDDMGGLFHYMKITFISMLLAAFSLSGVPFFQGFWSKDSVLEAAAESGNLWLLTLGTLTAAFTSFYSLRLILRVFTGLKSEKVKHLEHIHHIHEAHPVMLMPYLILAMAAFIIGLIWPIYGPEINSSIVKYVLGIEEHYIIHEIHLNPLLTTASIAMVTIGFSSSLSIYKVFKIDTSSVLKRSSIARLIHGLLYDRYYINPIYYRVLVNGFRGISLMVFKWFDKLVIDDLYHKLIPLMFNKLFNILFRCFEVPVIDEGYNVHTVNGVLKLSAFIRKLQSGILNNYLTTFIIGIALMITLLIILMV